MQTFKVPVACGRIATSLARSGELGHAARSVPVGHIDIAVLIDETAMRGAEESVSNSARLHIVIRPLRPSWIVAEECNRNIVLVEDRHPAFKFRNNGVITVKAHLAWPPEMLRHSANELPVEIEMAEAAILAIAHEDKRLIVAHVDCEPVAAVQQAPGAPFAGVGAFVLTAFVEVENARVPVSVCDEDATIGRGHCRGKPPFVRCFEPGLRWSGDLLHDRTVGPHLDEQPVLLRSSLLNGRVEVFLAILLLVN